MAAWHENTSSLNFGKDTCNLWKLTKLLNEDNPERRKTVLESEGELLTQKRAANCLAKHYEEESSVKVSRQVREQQTQKQDPPPSDSCMTEAISMEEVELAIRQLKCKKALGPDGVTHDMIKKFGLRTKRTLLKLCNESLKTGTVPVMWKTATIIHIHHKGKATKHPSSYRSVNLLSCFGKLLETVINRILLSFLEDNTVLSQTQTGYRKHISTEDHLALIAQEIENAFQEKKKVVAVNGMARGPSTEGTPELDIRENIQMDPLLSTRQISKSQTRWIRE